MGIAVFLLNHHIAALKVIVNIVRNKSRLEAAFFAYSLILSGNVQIFRKYEFDAPYSYIAAGIAGMRRDRHGFHTALVFHVIITHLGDNCRQSHPLMRADIF